MSATYQDLFLEQGTTFNSTIVLKDANGLPMNLTGYTATSQIKKSYYTANISGTFVANTGNVSLGIVSISLDSANTANIRAGRYLYDVYLTSNTSRQRVREGIVIISPQVTSI